jgi:hypothetical protein
MTAAQGTGSSVPVGELVSTACVEKSLLWLARHRIVAKIFLDVVTVTWRGKYFGMFAAGPEPKRLPATFVAVTALVIATLKLSVPSSSTGRDFEECAEWSRKMFLGAERVARTMDCGARFVGRQKMGGGYAYYDLFQNRSFDIAGPNPTANERARIYSEYKRFLELQRREAALAEIQQPVAEEPRVVALSMPIDVRRPKQSKLEACTIKGSLSCTWVKLASTVRNAFASSGSKPVAPTNSR